MTTTKHLTTADLKAALLKAYALPEYATFLEVGDGTGHLQSRWADAIAMACWPSRGLAITGFEIKASRSDWLREKKDPKKSAAVQKYCDHWILFTAPDVVKPGELPATWGHTELRGRRLRHLVKPPKLSPEPLSRTFVAALLRRAGEQSKDILQATTRQAIQEAEEQIDARVKQEVANQTHRFKELTEAVQAFKEATGIDLSHRYLGESLAKDFLVFQKVRDQLQLHSGFKYTEKRLHEAATALRTAQEALVECGLVDTP